MQHPFPRKALFGLFTLALSSFADNPLSNNYLADPAIATVGDSVLYIIADTDYDNVPDANGKTNYNMKAGYLLSTKDMKNWTDHGEIFRVPRDVSWAGGVWAPGAVWRNGKMWIYYPNGGYGVGVVSSSNPAGPYTDPIGKLLVGGAGAVSCDGVNWCFDPGIFVDTDGQAYLHWGGGKNADRPYGSNFSIVKLKSDMITPDGAPMKMTGSGESFEASYINKRNGKYYLSYNTSDQKIGYSISTSPTGPWNDMGIAMENPNINGTNINAWNNSHHGFSEFKGKWYAAYHERRVAIANNDPEAAYHRSVSIDELKFDADGKITPFVFTNSGPGQVGTFNPYDSFPAVTGSLSKNIKTQSVPVANTAANNLLLPVPSGTNGSWLRLSSVNFGTTDKLMFKVNAASTNANNKVEIRSGSATGTLAGTCALANTGSISTFASTECVLTGLTGVVSELYLKFIGTDNSMALKWWRFANVSTAPPPVQAPYNSQKTMTIPGIIEAEHYDLGGEGLAYHDADGENSGKLFRTDGVDIDQTTDGYALGWTEVGEWTEYTVRVDSSIAYDWSVRASAGIDGAMVRLYLDDADISGAIAVPNTTDWKTYTTLSGSTPVLTKGSRVLKIAIEGKYANIDWIQFSAPIVIPTPDPVTPVTPVDPAPKTETPVSLLNPNLAHPTTSTICEVFNAHGSYVGKIQFSTTGRMQSSLRALGLQKGLYIVRPQGSTMGISVRIQK
jgi:arabinoxylan arabinofuranohydrolase